MLIDTHCHLDAPEFDSDRMLVAADALSAGVGRIVIPAVHRANFSAVRELAHALPEGAGAYALGIHPLYVPDADETDLEDLDRQLAEHAGDPRLVAIGEIGLDFFVGDLNEPLMREKQERFYAAQLDMAVRHGLPVILHVRKSQDALLKQLRKRPQIGGIAHAFNGSFQQARQFLDQGFVLGFGGAMTFDRALQIRRLAATLPDEAIVLETDAPDIPPSWLSLPGEAKGRNAPAELARIAQELAMLRSRNVDEIRRRTTVNACRALPRLAALA